VKFLLDTHAVLWAIADPDRLSADARARMEAPSSTVLVSAASAWEIGIKRALGKLDFEGALHTHLPRLRFQPLPISLAHATLAGDLPMVHRDPFDRLLVAQAMLEGATLISRDAALAAYDVEVTPA
jgi:PIN domain nuclease of toxin-antitoxin system